MHSLDTRRTIRSFVLRRGRLTPAQHTAIERLFPKYGLVPAYGSLDLQRIFGRNAHRTLEIGFGDGDSLAELASSHPQRDFLGIEVHRPGVGRLLMRLENEQIKNVRVLCADAVEVLSQCISDECLDTVLVYFPDPWPKKRHHKRRLIQPEFVELMVRKLKRGGQLQLATDWPEYAAYMLSVLSASQGLRNTVAGSGFAERPSARQLTKFERRGIALGSRVFDLNFKKL